MVNGRLQMFDNFIFPILCRMASPTLHISFVMLLSKFIKLFHGMSEMQAKSIKLTESIFVMRQQPPLWHHL
jgi:hypothetical protein